MDKIKIVLVSVMFVFFSCKFPSVFKKSPELEVSFINDKYSGEISQGKLHIVNKNQNDIKITGITINNKYHLVCAYSTEHHNYYTEPTLKTNLNYKYAVSTVTTLIKGIPHTVEFDTSMGGSSFASFLFYRFNNSSDWGRNFSVISNLWAAGYIRAPLIIAGLA